MYDVVVNLMQDSVVELSCPITPIYITGSTMFPLFLHLWNGRVEIVHHDVCIIFVFEKVPHIVVEETVLAHFKFQLLWDMNGKLIPILTVIQQ